MLFAHFIVFQNTRLRIWFLRWIIRWIVHFWFYNTTDKNVKWDFHTSYKLQDNHRHITCVDYFPFYSRRHNQSIRGLIRLQRLSSHITSSLSHWHAKYHFHESRFTIKAILLVTFMKHCKLRGTFSSISTSCNYLLYREVVTKLFSTLILPFFWYFLLVVPPVRHRNQNQNKHSPNTKRVSRHCDRKYSPNRISKFLLVSKRIPWQFVSDKLFLRNKFHFWFFIIIIEPYSTLPYRWTCSEVTNQEMMLVHFKVKNFWITVFWVFWKVITEEKKFN